MAPPDHGHAAASLYPMLEVQQYAASFPKRSSQLSAQCADKRA